MAFDLDKYTNLIEIKKHLGHIETTLNSMKRSNFEIYLAAYSPLIVATLGAITTIFVAYKMFDKTKAKDQALKQIDVNLKLDERRGLIYGELMDSYLKTRDIFRKQFTDLLNMYYQKGLYTHEKENPEVDDIYEILNGINDKIKELNDQYEIDSKEHKEVYSKFVTTYPSTIPRPN